MEDRISIHFLAPKQNFMKTVGNPHFLFFPFLKAMSTCRTGKISLYNLVNKIGGFLAMDRELILSPYSGLAVSKDQQVMVRLQVHPGHRRIEAPSEILCLILEFRGRPPVW